MPVKILHFKALYKFEEYVVEGLKCEEAGVQIKFAFDKRNCINCPHCSKKLAKNKEGKSCVLDSSMGGSRVLII